MEKKVLIAEDEANLRRLVASYLKKEGFAVVEAADGIDAMDRFSEDVFTLVILDIMMPRKDGLTVCREIRAQSEVPILMLTARSQEYDELSGFSCGADEYVTKPFRPAILIARIQSLLKRTDSGMADKATCADIVLFRRERRVEVAGQAVLLTPREFELLAYLMANRNIALSREQLLGRVWGYDYDGDDRTVDTHIKCLRSKLGTSGERVRTIRKHGYMLHE